ncbi:hypothetical protein BH688_07045 [Kushneria phosphatilytica]|nr:hypothetical protein BH688_07045 [Kushneria phosphatilytica]
MHNPRDPLRMLAITSQMVGFILIIILQTLLPPSQARPLQAAVLIVMLTIAVSVALMRRYRRNRRWRDRLRHASSARATEDSDD